jgi:hypothetical protein
MHRAQERFSAWTFVQALRSNAESGLRAGTIGRPYRSACSSFGGPSGRNHSQTVRLALPGRWIEDSYPNIARGKYEETIQFGWSTISEIFKSTTRLAST